MKLYILITAASSEIRSCVKVEEDVLDVLMSLTVSVDVKQH